MTLRDRCALTHRPQAVQGVLNAILGPSCRRTTTAPISAPASIVTRATPSTREGLPHLLPALMLAEQRAGGKLRYALAS